MRQRVFSVKTYWSSAEGWVGCKDRRGKRCMKGVKGIMKMSDVIDEG